MFSEDIDWEEIVDEENNTELGELYDDLCKDFGHKIGGYPFYTDRSKEWEEKYQQHDILLLQIDTDDSLNIMWEILVLLISLLKRRFVKSRFFQCYLQLGLLLKDINEILAS